MSSSWTTIEDLIYTWVSTGASLPVIWQRDQGPRLTSQYISLRGSVQNMGKGWTYTRDAAIPAPGAEITRTHCTDKKLSIQIQCFAGSATGSTAPEHVLSDLIDSSRLPSQLAIFRDGGWGPAKFEPIQTLSGIVGGATFEPRAILNCHGYITGEISETSTYIEIVQGTNLITGEAFEVTS